MEEYDDITDKGSEIMTIIKQDDYVFSVDIERTKDYYKTHSVCDCICCCNFYAQIENKLPKLAQFLEEFGVDISRPDEICSIESNNAIDYLSVDYTVCGSVDNMSKYEMDICDNLFLNVIVTEGFVSPNEQTGDYFTLSVSNIILPWVLEEPFPSTIKIEKVKEARSIFKNLIKKIR